MTNIISQIAFVNCYVSVSLSAFAFNQEVINEYCVILGRVWLKEEMIKF